MRGCLLCQRNRKTWSAMSSIKTSHLNSSIILSWLIQNSAREWLQKFSISHNPAILNKGKLQMMELSNHTKAWKNNNQTKPNKHWNKQEKMLKSSTLVPHDSSAVISLTTVNHHRHEWLHKFQLFGNPVTLHEGQGHSNCNQTVEIYHGVKTRTIIYQ